MLFGKTTVCRFFISSLILLISVSVNASVNLSDTSRINSILKSSQIALDSSNWTKSRQLTSEALKQSEQIDYIFGKAKSIVLLAQVQSISGAKDSSIINFRKALTLFTSINKVKEIGVIHYLVGVEFCDIGNQDSAEYHLNKGLEIKKEYGDKGGIAAIYNSLGAVFFYRANYAKALEYYFSSVKLHDELGDKRAKSATFNNIGSVFKSQGDYTKALDFFIQSLKIQEEYKAFKGIAFINNNIGLIYQQLGDTSEALKHFRISLENGKQTGDSAVMSYALMGIGEIHHIKKEYQKALEYYSIVEKIRKKHSNLIGLANLYIDMSRVYIDMNDYSKTIGSLQQAQSIYEKINDPIGKANTLIGIGDVYFKQGLIQSAIENCNSGIQMAKKFGVLEIIRDGYFTLNKIYEKVGDNTLAYKAYKSYIEYRDSIGGIEKTKELQRIKFESDLNNLFSKERLENENKLNIAENKTIKQTRIANAFILAFIITLFGFILIFFNYRQKQKRNNFLAFQKLDMERQRTELTAQRDELEIQKNLVIHQRDKIMTMLTDLGESIDYARKIQQALLPSDKALANILGEYFLFFQPRESVGGDFYWLYQDEDLIYFAVADCTGHGVPGGFMSMLGVSLLNEQVSRGEYVSPAEMLWNLREMIVKALNQTGLDDDSQDGMDIALCTYNKKNRELLYAGANQSLFLVTENPPEPSELVFVQENMVELKPDRMPVSFYLRMKEFNEHRLTLSPGDSIYLSSDGFADQFGGPNNKKFGYNTFRNLLLSISSKPFDKQRDLLWNEFDKWKGEESQTDDVIVLGIKIS
ncbi:MAG TPA: hypothetical protein DIW31_09665 [Bacteroidales bacterium]|nr:hypothetical protein [Bacteroidales bacterium]